MGSKLMIGPGWTLDLERFERALTPAEADSLRQVLAGWARLTREYGARIVLPGADDRRYNEHERAALESLYTREGAR